MSKVEIENLLIKVLQEKQSDSHPCLQYLSNRLCVIYFLHCSETADDDRISRTRDKYLIFCDIYKEFKKSNHH